MDNIETRQDSLKNDGYEVAGFYNWHEDLLETKCCYIAYKDGKFYYIHPDKLVEFNPENLNDRLFARLYRTFRELELASQNLWEAACCGKIEQLAEHYESGGKTDLRYRAFGKSHNGSRARGI